MDRSLLDCLDRRAAENGDSLAYSYEEGAAEAAWLTYGELDRRARATAALLTAVAKAGDTVLLLYPQGLDFISAFLGCLMAGVVAVPMFPPKLNRADPRLKGIIEDSGTRLVLTNREVFTRRTKYFQHLPELAELHWIDSSAAPAVSPATAVPYRPAKDSLAFLQYTSGSTGTPRGVMVSHGNLLANLEDIDRGSVHTGESILVSWLPFYHDMGLIYGLLMPLYKGFVCHLMAPAFVLQKPLLWLEAISRYRATHSAAPNFAYDLCARTITRQQSAGLDLSRWQTAGNGAEPVHRDTLDRFAAAFRHCGFDPRAFCPCYGLAEATLKVAAIRRDQAPVYVRVDRRALEHHRFALADPADPLDPADTGTTTLVSCGASEIATRIRIVNPDTGRCAADDEIGEIWVAGETVACGYWRCPEETRATFTAQLADTGEGPFLRTGDLGIFHDGGLLVTGRLKDLLIFQGANHYPSDIETTVGRCHPALRPDAAAAFTVAGAAGGEERLVIVQEIERSALHRLDLAAVVGAVCAAVALDHGLQVHALVLLRPMSIPKTSSGKIQRQACREDYLAERLHAAASWSRRLSETPDMPATPATPRPAATTAGPAGAARPERSAVEAWLVASLAGQLGLPPGDLDVGEPFARYGLGSSDAVRLSAALADWLGFPVPPTIAYDHPTVAALATHLSGSAASPETRENPQPQLAEPIAILGIGCRFPGADGPEAFWELLANGVDAISEVPPERWDAAALFDPDGRQPGRMRTRFGGFLRGVERFDAAFFGISPHEAKRVDPQQRLLLEVAWEALEHAGLAADRLAGSATGVFVGVCANDYARFQTADPRQIDGYTGTGNALSLTANRLSYALDLRGPSLALDTACSSSLVALHQACLSLRTGECDTALAGGVNLTLTPHSTIAFSQAGMLAADGRCKTFDAAADGYVRGEGCGLVVLKRLGDALAAGDRVLAVIRGSAVNQDGRSNGLAAPNRQAQEAVIAGALRLAGVAPGTIDYVEAHGTGTALGDPIEVSALKAVLLAGRAPDRRCALGSVKTNIGHLEAAAGIAGVIKTVLALDREVIPPNLHLTRLNDQISLADTPLYVPTRPMPWTRGALPRRAGVSSFGFGGTNAHLILEESPLLARPPTPAPGSDRTWHVLSLSAKSEGALGELARRYCTLLDRPQPPLLPDLCFSANTGRSLLPYRAAFAADSPAALLSRLRALAADQSRSGVHRGRVRSPRPKLAFLFTGQGSQHAGMGLRLYQSQPAFRAALDRCEEILRAVAGFSLLALLRGDAAAGSLRETRFAQPVLFALQHALLTLWRSWGVTPDAVLGHSVGEYAAAHAAGILALEDGLALLAERGRLMQQAPGRGAMATVFAGEAQVRTAVASQAGRVAIAALNGPRQVVVSGEAAAVASVLALLTAQGIRVHDLGATHGFHSPLMAGVAEPFARLLARIEPSPATLPLVADLSGEVVAPGGSLSAEYWLRHLTEPVRFAAAIGRLIGDGYGLFLELGPSATLSAMARRSAGKDAATWLSSLLPERPQEKTMLDALAALHTRGVAVDWRAFDAPFTRRRITLPTYPFERQAYWYGAPVDERMTADPAVAADSSVRQAAILAHLREAIGSLLELAPATIDPDVPFLELGADSIVLVGLVRNIEETYAIELPVRLFFEEAHSLSLLAAYLEAHTAVVPPRSAAPAIPAVPAVIGVTPLPAPAGHAPGPLAGAELGQLFQRQLDVVSRLMEQQLAALAAAAPTLPPAAPTPAAAVATVGAVPRPPAIEPPNLVAPPGRPAFSLGHLAEEQRALTPRQRRYVDDLTQRLCHRTPSSREEADRHRAHWADLRMTMGFRPDTKEMCFPIVAERSTGARVHDREGNEYVDLAMGFGVNLFGHNPPFVMAAMRAQLERGIHLGVQSDLAGEVAARIAAMTGMERVTFCNSGTEAVMTAIRLARAVTGRVRFVQFSGSYHGHADPTLAVARPGEDPRAGADPMAAGVPESTSRQVIVLPYGEERALKTIAALLPELAAVLVEPVQSRRPELQPADFLRRLRALTLEAKVPLLFDEVITGFRSHPRGAQGYFGVEADLAIYGKALGGG
ncbi:MAG TPA: aminotransferase class III-fold pyridoxal phosphate-dependent enzyme, partial [Thermoanaerobaculia bacterium]|nr:aminotransferase class III-fold pyridoxal phosphate-dependent enzyme [Thermoanaerobaculia bacterium]